MFELFFSTYKLFPVQFTFLHYCQPKSGLLARTRRKKMFDALIQRAPVCEASSYKSPACLLVDVGVEVLAFPAIYDPGFV